MSGGILVHEHVIYSESGDQPMSDEVVEITAFLEDCFVCELCREVNDARNARSELKAMTDKYMPWISDSMSFLEVAMKIRDRVGELAGHKPFKSHLTPGWDALRTGTRIPPEMLHRVVEMRRTKSAIQIAKELGKTRSTIHRYLRLAADQGITGERRSPRRLTSGGGVDL